MSRERRGVPAIFGGSPPAWLRPCAASSLCRRMLVFFAWLEQHGADKFAILGRSTSAPKSRRCNPRPPRQHFAAIRMLFDWLVVGLVLAVGSTSKSGPSRA